MSINKEMIMALLPADGNPSIETVNFPDVGFTFDAGDHF